MKTYKVEEIDFQVLAEICTNFDADNEQHTNALRNAVEGFAKCHAYALANGLTANEKEVAFCTIKDNGDSAPFVQVTDIEGKSARTPRTLYEKRWNIAVPKETIVKERVATTRVTLTDKEKAQRIVDNWGALYTLTEEITNTDIANADKVDNLARLMKLVDNEDIAALLKWEEGAKDDSMSNIVANIRNVTAAALEGISKVLDKAFKGFEIESVDVSEIAPKIVEARKAEQRKAEERERAFDTLYTMTLRKYCAMEEAKRAARFEAAIEDNLCTEADVKKAIARFEAETAQERANETTDKPTINEGNEN